MQRHLLSARDALHIAAQYGFSATKERTLIRDSIVKARMAGERPASWQEGRRKSALQHFDDFMAAAAAALPRT